MYTMNSSLFNEVDANITTIRFIDPSNLDMMNVVQVTDVNRVATEVALINDMTVLFAKSFNDNETFAKSLLPLLQLECDGTKRWPFGEQILQNIDQVRSNFVTFISTQFNFVSFADIYAERNDTSDSF